ncbi:MAG: hypothetical protein HYY55_01580 [Candidatus Niyogibacteria bacterium]|nr:MAG: hypothetical protein HYY55_01580 [Candidatus Niyogibacteria bacterium]
MPHISKRKLKKKAFLKMNDRFYAVMASLKDKNFGRLFFGDLLSSTERIMLAKRLAVILMLFNKYPFTVVEKTLKVSPSTVGRLWKGMRGGDFDNIKAIIVDAKKKRGFIDDLEILLSAGLPPRGRGRWKWFYDMMNKE